VCFGGGLTEENCQCGIVCALRVSEATERDVFVPERGDEVDTYRGRPQLIGLNLLIPITIWVEAW